MALDSGAILDQLRHAGLMTADPAARGSGLWAMAEPGSPLPNVFEASSMAALQKLQHSQEMASPLWAGARAGSQMPSVLEARRAAAPQKPPLWAMAEPGSPMPDALEAFCTAAPRQLGLAGSMSTEPWGLVLPSCMPLAMQLSGIRFLPRRRTWPRMLAPSGDGCASPGR